MASLHIAVLGSSRGTSLQPIIDAIEAGELDVSIELVISNKPDAYILQRAKNHGLDTIHVPSAGKSRKIFEEELTYALKKRPIDLILLIGFMRILSGDFIDRWEGNVLNVHPSLLPKFPGGMDNDVHQAVLDAHETHSGCTIHYVDKGVDSGKILLQKTCPIAPDETVQSLKQKVQHLEGLAFIELLSTIRTKPSVYV